MNRRRFLQISGALSAFPWACAKAPRLPNSRSLVDSSENRKTYLQQMLKVICTETGPRRAGSDAYNRAAEFVKAEMAMGLPKVELDLKSGDRLLNSPIPQTEPADGNVPRNWELSSLEAVKNSRNSSLEFSL